MKIRRGLLLEERAVDAGTLLVREACNGPC